MGKQTIFWLLAVVLLLVVLNSAVAEKIHFMVGGEVTLELQPPFSGSISNILWKHKGNLLAEWVKGKVPLTYYGWFSENDRTTLNTDTARLEITDMRSSDAGLFTVEINNKIQDQSFDAKLFKGVPQPEIVVRPLVCSSASDRCTLSCEGDTREAEPVTYSWKEGDGEWKQSGKDLDIFKNETAHVETFSCRMNNPVSVNISEPEANPFLKKKPSMQPEVLSIALRAMLLMALFGVLVGFFAWRKRETVRKLICPCQDRNGADN